MSKPNPKTRPLPRLRRKPTDPWLPARLRHDSQAAGWELAANDAVLGAWAAGLDAVWRHAMDTPAGLLTITAPPDEAGGLTAADGLPDIPAALAAARRAWEDALARFLAPILRAILGARWRGVFDAVMDQVDDTTAATYAHLATVPNRLVEAYWADTLERIGRTLDEVFDDMRVAMLDAQSRGETIEQIRDRIARILQIDAGTRELLQQIDTIERRLFNTGLSPARRRDLLDRRVDLLHQLFLATGGAAEARAFLRAADAWDAYARTLPPGPERDRTAAEASRLRADARRVTPPAGGEDQIRRELDQIDRELYRNPDLSEQEYKTLDERRRRLYEQAEQEERSWRYRARRIARTETIGSTNGGTLDAAKTLADATGLELHKRWLATHDSRVRPTHLEADRQSVPVDDPFHVGGAELMFPGDPSGPPQEVIQCRCSLLLESPGDAEILDSLAAGGGRLLEVAMTDHHSLAAMLAAVTGSTDLPVADRDRAWDGPAAAGRVLDKYTGDSGRIDVASASRAFLLRDGDGQRRGDYRLGFADVIDGQLRIVPRGVAALAGGHGVEQVKGIPADTLESLRGKVCRLYARVRSALDDWPDCPFSTNARGMSAATAATDTDVDVDEVVDDPASADLPPLVTVAAGNAPLAPPAAWFDDPHLPGPSPLVVTREGRVMGHVAAWADCHASYPDVCVQPPRSASGYAHFHYGTVITADGTPVRVGKLTVGGGHASLDKDLRAAAEHYDNLATAAAVVRAGEDTHGIWVSGALTPGVTPEQVYALLASPLSGDWRVPAGSTGLELIAAHAVNVPGFGIRAAATVSEAGQLSLVAAGVIRPDEIAARLRAGRVATLAASIGMDPRSMADLIAADLGI